jgi:hypothetical protein
MSQAVSLHVNVLAWTGFEDKARVIEEAVRPHADQVSVIYSVPDNPPPIPDTWTTVDYECFYGCKFAKTLQLHEGGILLQIQADASVPDWGHLISRCRQAFSNHPEIGVWAPDVDYTMWVTDKVFLRDFDKNNSLISVRQTDGIVWAMSDNVVERMKQADYSDNRLGYGIDSLAIAFSYANNMVVCRDTSIVVDHPKGKRYSHEEATTQFEKFLNQFSHQERIQHSITRRPQTKLRTKDLVYLLAKRLLGRDT